MTLAERGVGTPTVSLADLLRSGRPPVSGKTDVGLEIYVDEILASGLPGLRGLRGRPLRAALDGYIDRIVEHDFPQMGHGVRNPTALRAWMTAYSAMLSSTAAYETIRAAATGGYGEKPSRGATQPYNDILQRLWILEPVPAWMPGKGFVSRLGQAPKHQVADPALAARLLKLDADGLLERKLPSASASGHSAMLGPLFESLVTLSVRVFAQAAECSVMHLRTRAPNEREIDLIVQRPDGKVLAIEIKLARAIGEDDVRHLGRKLIAAKTMWPWCPSPCSGPEGSHDTITDPPTVAHTRSRYNVHEARTSRAECRGFESRLPLQVLIAGRRAPVFGSQPRPLPVCWLRCGP